MSNVIEINKVCKKYGNKIVLDDLSLNIREGTILGLLGKNGAGKTTLMKAMLGLIKINQGEIIFHGVPLDDNYAGIMQSVGFLLEPAYYDYLTAEQNMIVNQMLYKKKDRNEITELLEFVGLEQVRKKKVSTFSFGMKQRLGLAQALVGRPEILILDEPIVGMDPEGMKSFKDRILELNHRYGTTIIFSSHQLVNVQDLCTEIAVIKEHGLYVHKPIGKIINHEYIFCTNKPISDKDIERLEERYERVKISGTELKILCNEEIEFQSIVQMLQDYSIVNYRKETTDLFQFFEEEKE